MKKLAAGVLSLAMLLCSAMPVSAGSAEKETSREKENIVAFNCGDETIILNEIKNIDIRNNCFYLNANARGVTKPTTSLEYFYDLSNGNNYNAALTVVSPARWLYTNKYFYSSSDGKLYVKYKVKLLAWYGANLNIAIFDLTQGTAYTKYESSKIESKTNYIQEQMFFSGLNPNHQYAIGFLSKSISGEAETITGAAIISQSYITGNINV